VRGLALTILMTAAVAELGCSTGHAGALQVSPLGLTLSEQRPIATLRIRNVGDRPALFEADTFAWTQSNGDDFYAPTSEVIVIPPIFRLAPGAQQFLRIGLPERLPPSDIERAYRVFLREVQPVEAPVNGRLRLPLRLGLPIFVRPTVARPGQPAWNLAGPTRRGQILRIVNRSAEHVKITSLDLLTAAGAIFGQIPLLQYSLPDTQVDIDVPPLPQPDVVDAIRVTFEFEDNVQTRELPVAHAPDAH
jgi:fimbrial chaperone protein